MKRKSMRQKNVRLISRIEIDQKYINGIRLILN